VSVVNTRAKGMTGHIILLVTHTLMMLNSVVIAQTIGFLQRGHLAPTLALTQAVQTPGVDGPPPRAPRKAGRR
jgi:hypothetical protein